MKVVSKLSLEFMPLFLFFVASAVWEGDFMRPTAVLVIMTAVALAVTWWAFHQPALMAIINAVTGMIAGGATLIFHEDTFVMMKPTFIGGIYAAILLAALLTNKPLFRALLGRTIHLTEEGWRVLTWLWLFYFVFITVLNEYVRVNYGFEEWAFFKVAILAPLTVLYAIPQRQLLKKYKPVEEEVVSHTAAPVRSASPKTEHNSNASLSALREPVS
ncbi:MAG: septation protein IspZ [Alphaproteobacteria bacterium]